MTVESRTERLERMLGQEGIALLSNATVMVVGIGGVGSNCVEALARGGIGSLVIIDDDVVQPSNINRQAIAFDSTVGRPKVEVMRDMIHDISPTASVACIRKRILPDDVVGLFEDNPVGYCIDAQDTVITKLALGAYCSSHDTPFLSSMGAANTVDPTRLEFADIYDTHSCPLSKAVRKQARKLDIEHMRVLYTPGRRMDTKPAEGSTRADRSDLGTMSYMPAIMGQMLAARAICDILGIEWR